MGHSKTNSATDEIDKIITYVDRSQGLNAIKMDSGKVRVVQEVDGKAFYFDVQEVSEVIPRTDSEGKHFIQVNFRSANKVLFTDTLIGFKPLDTLGLDMSRIPKVVTTPDLTSVFEAIEEALSTDGVDHEVEILKKVYFSILSGAEKVGFDLAFEKLWIGRLMASNFRASA